MIRVGGLEEQKNPERPNTMPPRPNVPNPALAQIKALGDNFTKLQNDFDTFKGESEKRDKILLEKFKVLTSHNKALRARIDDLEEVSFDAEPGEGLLKMSMVLMESRVHARLKWSYLKKSRTWSAVKRLLIQR